jgi:hypothetical protein
MEFRVLRRAGLVVIIVFVAGIMCLLAALDVR